MCSLILLLKHVFNGPIRQIIGEPICSALEANRLKFDSAVKSALNLQMNDSCGGVTGGVRYAKRPCVCFSIGAHIIGTYISPNKLVGGDKVSWNKTGALDSRKRRTNRAGEPVQTTPS